MQQESGDSQSFKSPKSGRHKEYLKHKFEETIIMKKFTILICLVITQKLMAQNVGIGVASPLHKLHVAGTTFLNGNVGIATSSILFPLSFSQAIGDKISLWSNSANSYGFGIQGSLLQIHTDIAAADIAFGYGSSTSFNETMRIKGNGNTGIGLSDPAYKLDINGRMRIRTGADGEAGIFLNNAANTNSVALVGLENDSYVGFAGIGTGWSFAMNTQTGALKINGSEGLAGQTLQSNGTAAPSWNSISGWLYNNIFQMNQGVAALTLAPNSGRTILPNMGTGNLSVNVTKNSKLIMTAFVNINTNFCNTCTFSNVRLGMSYYKNGVHYEYAIANASLNNYKTFGHNNGISVFDITTGVYTFETYVYSDDGLASVDFNNGRLFIAIIPQ